MQKIVVNAFILTVSIAVLHTIVFLGTAYLLSPGHLLIPRSLSGSIALDIFIICVLPAVLISAAYVLISIWAKRIDFLKFFMNILPLILLVTVIFAVDDTFRYAVRDFDERDFFSYANPAGIAFVFPNTMRIWFMAIITTIILAALKWQLFPEVPGSPDETTHPKNRVANILSFAAAFFMPSILLFDLYNRNRIDNHLVFNHMLIFAGVLAVIGVVIFPVFKLVAKSAEAALLLCVIFWLCFWLFEALFGIAADLYGSLTSIRLIVYLLALIASLVLLIQKYNPHFYKISSAFNILCAVLIVLFIMNIAPAVSHEIELHRTRATGSVEGNSPFYIKREFYIDSELPNPDIYWFHLDGMMSMETVERFWGVSQDHLREELSNRGFIVYPNAELYPGFTDASLPALFSPTFYDSFWGERVYQARTMLRTPRASFLINELTQVGLTYPYLVRYYEMFHAFVKRGYEIEMGASSHRWPHSFGHFTGDGNDLWTWHQFLENSGDFPELLNLTTPLNITPFSERRATDVRQSLYGSDYESSARFVLVHMADTHASNVWRHDPTLSSGDSTAVHVYQLAHAQIARRALNRVDSILEENPGAVIVLQSDHGFHIEETQQFMLDQGYSLEELMELIHSVFSAVRIPPEYGGLDAPIAPLNISRELVNRFVGENYELIP